MSGLTSQPEKAADHHSTAILLTADDAFKAAGDFANVKQLQSDLHEAKSRNIYLNDLVEEQKRYKNIFRKHLKLFSLQKSLPMCK